MRANFSLYIKQDGDQQIEVKDSNPRTITTLTPLTEHPDYQTNQDTDSTSAIEYTVPVRDTATEDPPALTIYYRNTAKKFETIYSGSGKGKIDGKPSVIDSKLDGTLTNGTGQPLSDIYFAYKDASSNSYDWVLWMKDWQPGVSIDLAKTFWPTGANALPLLSRQSGAVPGGNKITRLAAMIRIWQDE